jgi:Type ISP C-terminal specificity domain
MKNKKERLGKVFHYDLYGLREKKYDFLKEKSLKDIDFVELKNDVPYYFFVPKDFELKDEYENCFKIPELMHNYNTGIQTKCDELSIQLMKDELESIVSNFKEKTIEELKLLYPNKKDSSGWNFQNAKDDLINNNIHLTKILYRPFDFRYTVYTGKSSGFIGRPRVSTMFHMLKSDNLGLVTLRLNGENEEFVSLVTDNIIEKGSLPRGNYSIFPLYLYPDPDEQETLADTNQPPSVPPSKRGAKKNPKPGQKNSRKNCKRAWSHLHPRKGKKDWNICTN